MVDRPLGILQFVLRLAVFGYIIGFVIIYKKGYNPPPPRLPTPVPRLSALPDAPRRPQLLHVRAARRQHAHDAACPRVQRHKEQPAP